MPSQTIAVDRAPYHRHGFRCHLDLSSECRGEQRCKRRVSLWEQRALVANQHHGHATLSRKLPVTKDAKILQATTRNFGKEILDDVDRTEWRRYRPAHQHQLLLGQE